MIRSCFHLCSSPTVSYVHLADRINCCVVSTGVYFVESRQAVEHIHVPCL